MTVPLSPNTLDYGRTGEPFTYLIGIASNTSLHYQHDGEIYQGLSQNGVMETLAAATAVSEISGVVAAGSTASVAVVARQSSVSATASLAATSRISVLASVQATPSMKATVLLSSTSFASNIVVLVASATINASQSVEGFPELEAYAEIYWLCGATIVDPEYFGEAGMVAIGGEAPNAPAVIGAQASMLAAPMFTLWGDRMRARALD